MVNLGGKSHELQTCCQTVHQLTRLVLGDLVPKSNMAYRRGMGLTIQSIHLHGVGPSSLSMDFGKVRCFLFDADWSSPFEVLKLSTVLMLPSICLSKYFGKQRGFKL